MECCFFPPESPFLLCNSDMKVLSLIYTLTWSVSSYIFRQGKGISRRNESTNIISYRNDASN